MSRRQSSLNVNKPFGGGTIIKASVGDSGMALILTVIVVLTASKLTPAQNNSLPLATVNPPTSTIKETSTNPDITTIQPLLDKILSTNTSKTVKYDENVANSSSVTSNQAPSSTITPSSETDSSTSLTASSTQLLLTTSLSTVAPTSPGTTTPRPTTVTTPPTTTKPATSPITILTSVTSSSSPTTIITTSKTATTKSTPAVTPESLPTSASILTTEPIETTTTEQPATTSVPPGETNKWLSAFLSVFIVLAVILLIGVAVWFIRRRRQLERLRHQLMPVYNFDPTDDADDWENQLLEEERSLRPEADKVQMYSGNSTFDPNQRESTNMTPKD